MAREKRSVTATIESLEQKEDSKTGWGKYSVELEGYDKRFPVAVPPDVHKEYDLEEGYVVTLLEGSYSDWIVSPKSEFLTGEEYEQEASAPKKKAAPKKATSTYKKKTEDVEETPEPAPRKTVAKKSDSAKHTAWNQYQISVRDPQMRMQTLLQISFDAHKFCFENELDADGFFKTVTGDAKRLNKTLLEYLSDDSHI